MTSESKLENLTVSWKRPSRFGLQSVTALVFTTSVLRHLADSLEAFNDYTPQQTTIENFGYFLGEVSLPLIYASTTSLLGVVATIGAGMFFDKKLAKYFK